jgi:hypothetical protein
LIVDGECGNLLDELQEIYSAVEKGRLEVALKINLGAAPIRF